MEFIFNGTIFVAVLIGAAIVAYTIALIRSADDEVERFRSISKGERGLPDDDFELEASAEDAPGQGGEK